MASTTLTARLAALGVRVPDLLLPAPGTDLSKWAVVACDQFTSEPEYWAEAERLVGDAPSMLPMIYPEVYLEDGTDRVPLIQAAMHKALASGVFAPPMKGFMLVARQTTQGERLGLVLSVDLEAYDYDPAAGALIRATEGTILSRIPPRMRIRQDAPLESPHIMLLVDDPGRTLIEPIHTRLSHEAPCYDVALMLGGGRLRGWPVQGGGIADAATALEALQAAAGEPPLLFAVGDGNHSLATARACWLALRDTLPEAERADHPARYALVEVVNLHDPALVFEPIHRALFGIDPDALLPAFEQWLAAQGASLTTAPTGAQDQRLQWLAGGKRQALFIHHAPMGLPVATLQAFLDDWLKTQPGARIDYIHGEAALAKLCAQPSCGGFLLEGIDKAHLFPAIRQDGVLPRKTFSMGEAQDKRYYMECRKLKP